MFRGWDRLRFIVLAWAALFTRFVLIIALERRLTGLGVIWWVLGKRMLRKRDVVLLDRPSACLNLMGWRGRFPSSSYRISPAKGKGGVRLCMISSASIKAMTVFKHHRFTRGSKKHKV